MYPNPAIEYFKIKSNVDLGRLSIYNLVGSEIKSFEYQKEGVYYIADLPAGMYLVQLREESGRILRTIRLHKSGGV
jgi:hypothetical protein